MKKKEDCGMKMMWPIFEAQYKHLPGQNEENNQKNVILQPTMP